MEPRPAATVIVARPAGEGIEVLALARASGSRFAPGFVVFPGGVIEPKDQPLAERWFGDPAEAARACALRELYEEAGLLLTSQGLEAPGPGQPIERLRFDPPAPDALVEVGRWVAPEFLETRFDATFFATGAPGNVQAAPDGNEIADARWARPGDLLAAAGRGEGPLMWPTQVTLEALATCASVTDVLSLRIEQVPRPR
jgi:8-oxo-dGTP pyrophosphatase MutT (NUDIX family)